MKGCPGVFSLGKGYTAMWGRIIIRLVFIALMALIAYQVLGGQADPRVRATRGRWSLVADASFTAIFVVAAIKLARQVLRESKFLIGSERRTGNYDLRFLADKTLELDAVTGTGPCLVVLQFSETPKVIAGAPVIHLYATAQDETGRPLLHEDVELRRGAKGARAGADMNIEHEGNWQLLLSFRAVESRVLGRSFRLPRKTRVAGLHCTVSLVCRGTLGALPDTPLICHDSGYRKQ